MKAPDKIFLYRGHPEPYWFKDKQLDSDVEYIRKDALMEWAKECFRLQDSGSWYSKGAADAFSELIDKINSM